MTRHVDAIGCGRTYDPRRDVRLTQDMEAELAADVEFFDHPTRGRIRLEDELVHNPATAPGWAHRQPELAAEEPDEWEPA